jgi:prevent-host-death family protein
MKMPSTLPRHLARGLRSDNLISVKRLSATDAARSFSDVLDSVEGKGESYVVMRRGRAVAVIGPVAEGNGRAVKELFGSHPVDGDWAGELRELREAIGPADVGPWRG